MSKTDLYPSNLLMTLVRMSVSLKDLIFYDWSHGKTFERLHSAFLVLLSFDKIFVHIFCVSFRLPLPFRYLPFTPQHDVARSQIFGMCFICQWYVELIWTLYD